MHYSTATYLIMPGLSIGKSSKSVFFSPTPGCRVLKQRRGYTPLKLGWLDTLTYTLTIGQYFYLSGATLPSILKTPSVTISFIFAPSASFSIASKSAIQQ